MLAITSGGTIPDRGLFGVFTPEGVRVGELDEEMVYESRVGETFLLGATTWRIGSDALNTTACSTLSRAITVEGACLALDDENRAVCVSEPSIRPLPVVDRHLTVAGRAAR